MAEKERYRGVVVSGLVRYYTGGCQYHSVGISVGEDGTKLTILFNSGKMREFPEEKDEVEVEGDMGFIQLPSGEDREVFFVRAISKVVFKNLMD